jgi:Tol biopolymer transport system component
MKRPIVLTALVLLVAACSGSAASTTGPSLAPPSGTPSAAPSAALSSTAATPAPTAAGLPAFAPDEPLVAFNRLTGAGGGLFVARPDGTGIQQLATDTLRGVHKRVDWSPDGQRIVFIDETSERMWIAHLDGSPTTSVAACDTPGCDFPAWSPDGTRIAFSRNESGTGLVGNCFVLL